MIPFRSRLLKSRHFALVKCVVFLMILAGFGLRSGAVLAERIPEPLTKVDVDEQLGVQLDHELSFTDHTGKAVQIGDYFDDERPVLLTLNYYSCDTLCGIQLNALLKGLQALDWTPGEQFRIVSVSIDPTETAELAAAKRDNYLGALDRGDVAWDFLVGSQENITALADSIGYRYTYDEATEQYVHPAVLTFLSPERTISLYLYGVLYPASDIKFALIEAAEGRVGSPFEKLVLSCFRYDSTTGRYTPYAFGMMRFGGVLTMLSLGAFGFVMWRREIANRQIGSAL